MMATIDRRAALRRLATGGAALATAAAAAPAVGASASGVAPLPEAEGMLYDTTRCIGCKACVTACYEANDLSPDRGAGVFPAPIYKAPTHLNEFTKNIIQLYREPGSPVSSFMKRQCMHCVDPACAAACMMHALKKDPRTGVVYWTGDACVGCRYCQIACPFNVPTFEWRALNPEIVKCELCRHRREGPACCEVCPREAVIHGRRADLLAEAHRRIAAHPDRYQPTVYGEREGGGTQVLYLSHVPFDKLALPALDDQSLPAYVHGVQGALYRGFVAPLALFGAIGLAVHRRQKRAARQSRMARRPDEAHPSPAEDEQVTR